MKTLLLMRHAKSSWKDKNLKDSERPLSKRGKRNAIQIGQVMVDNELWPEMILSSSVKRARQTTEFVKVTLASDCQTVYMDNLFMAEAEVILDALRLLPDALERVLVIGHNPGMEALMQLLTRQVLSLPTAGLCDISLPVKSWQELSGQTTGEMVQLWQPVESEPHK